MIDDETQASADQGTPETSIGGAAAVVEKPEGRKESQVQELVRLRKELLNANAECGKLLNEIEGHKEELQALRKEYRRQAELIFDRPIGDMTYHKAAGLNFRQHVVDWCRANGKTDERNLLHGVFPLGMVGGWIDRALRAEATCAAIKQEYAEVKEAMNETSSRDHHAWSHITTEEQRWRKFADGTAGASLLAELAELRAEKNRLTQACAKQNNEICQVLGKPLGYPINGPDSPDGPEGSAVIGEMTAEAMADEAAAKLSSLRAKLAEAERQVETLTEDLTIVLASERSARSEIESLKARLKQAERDGLKVTHDCDSLRADNERLTRERDEARAEAGRLTPYEGLYEHAIECVDRVFQVERGKPAPLLPDFLRLGENKFDGIIKLAESYQQYQALAQRRAKVLMEVEWHTPAWTVQRCPRCKHKREDGHSDRCPLAAALAEPE